MTDQTKEEIEAAVELPAVELPVGETMFEMETICDNYCSLVGSRANTIRKMSAKYSVFVPGTLVLMSYRKAVGEEPFARELIRVSGAMQGSLSQMIEFHTASNHSGLNEADLYNVLMDLYNDQDADYVAIYFE